LSDELEFFKTALLWTPSRLLPQTPQRVSSSKLTVPQWTHCFNSRALRLCDASFLAQYAFSPPLYCSALVGTPQLMGLGLLRLDQSVQSSLVRSTESPP